MGDSQGKVRAPPEVGGRGQETARVQELGHQENWGVGCTSEGDNALGFGESLEFSFTKHEGLMAHLERLYGLVCGWFSWRWESLTQN